MMKVYVEMGTPGEPHKQMSKMAGRWKTTMKSWMEPGQPPIESTGTSEQEMILGGRFLQDKETIQGI